MLKLPSPTSSLENIQTNQHPNTKSSMKTTRRSLPPSPLTSENPNPNPRPTTQPNPEPPAPPFRSVSACNRCRLRKHRCDQRLPRCESCEKAQVRCVGYDPLTKQEVPRSYVAFLESRVNYLNQVLLDHGIRFKPAIAYDEEETLKMEAGQVPFETLGLRKNALPQMQMQMQSRTQNGLGTRTSRKRKSHDSIPARQAKRLAQLNVLLTELLTDGCEHRQCSREPDYVRAASRHVPEDPIEQRLPWSPRSFDSIDHSDSRTTRSESVSSHEPYQYPRITPGYGSSLFGAKTVFGPDHGQEVHDARRQPGFELDLVDFESGIANSRSIVGGGKLGNTDVRHLNGLSRASSEESRSSPEPKFDIAADLLRGRRERERANYDLLDEFLVDWAD
ncbi:unnamed protein product [Penicillium nalgiovense]|uniref:Zn(2)-C6 fungal-type domain-containing protein n=1 Tax=Penicillium nalgiovense TaxID=60175 RepID=A0A1V6XTH5_PENNA|nr:hypothetical protein PENNAL_c0056G10868 [Penicillium nalgiovense]CAG8023380.1 unnamed protein product [Penicillium nalgiovense]CAG8107215.1 unnamed protein product [Penicillium nalgiovense]CAG8109976.1 unnamed protein product [Penicillium nalgiovense]CAG8114383.1 unnamed protein product [Penicillium nalgiovense]